MPALSQMELTPEALREPYNPLALYLAPAFLALLTHMAVQLREPGARTFVLLSALATAATTELLSVQWHLTRREALGAVGSMWGVYLVTINLSMAIYRLFFHRLRSFPGPTWMILSKWFVIPTDVKGDRPYVFQKLHQKYGPVFRAGPREISVADPDALSAIYGATGPAARGRRGPWYEFTKVSTTTRECSVHSFPVLNAPAGQDSHAVRRKVWDAAFSQQALKGYEDNIRSVANLTIGQMADRSQKCQSTDLLHWCKLYGFEVMLQIGFGKTLNMVENGEFHPVIKVLEDSVSFIMSSSNVVYIMSLFNSLPNPIAIFEKWIIATLNDRAREGKTGVVERDVMSHLLGEAKALGRKQRVSELGADAGLLVVAGSDTSSNGMTLALIELMARPETYKMLQQEVDEEFQGEPADDFSRLGKLKYLNAVIQETLRLWPPVASGLQRVTPKEGIVLPGNVHIPGNTIIYTSTYTMHRDAKNFSEPDRFLPERWLEPKKMQAHNPKAFAAFGYGPTSCIGRQVGLMEMRVVIARFVQSFEASFAPGFDVNAFRKTVKDMFVLTMGHVPVELKVRKGADVHAH